MLTNFTFAGIKKKITWDIENILETNEATSPQPLFHSLNFN